MTLKRGDMVRVYGTVPSCAFDTRHLYYIRGSVAVVTCVVDSDELTVRFLVSSDSIDVPGEVVAHPLQCRKVKHVRKNKAIRKRR